MEDYCEFLKRSAKIVDKLLEDWEKIDKEELRARIQLFQTALLTQIARNCGGR